jgi:hypothetical protein
MPNFSIKTILQLMKDSQLTETQLKAGLALSSLTFKTNIESQIRSEGGIPFPVLDKFLSSDLKVHRVAGAYQSIILSDVVEGGPKAVSLVAQGKFHDQGDAEWIVIRRSLWGHNDTPCGRNGWF